eukprot:TRINITY_DN9257_c0_g1_i1.p2 TRINITY_DN9257_c0_g1~~TRINITY_DN9257_c0_g1_i1.p2  ORF type:complete len:114 (+),score=39.43 TRINITY_DN9257_c0_g1_i1:98-439(+)
MARFGITTSARAVVALMFLLQPAMALNGVDWAALGDSLKAARAAEPHASPHAAAFLGAAGRDGTEQQSMFFLQTGAKMNSKHAEPEAKDEGVYFGYDDSEGAEALELTAPWDL